MSGPNNGSAPRPTRATSIAALRKRSPVARLRVLAALRDRGPGGGTFHDLVAATGSPPQSVTSTIRSLFKAGDVADSGRTCPGPYGRACTIWIAT